MLDSGIEKQEAKKQEAHFWRHFNCQNAAPSYKCPHDEIVTEAALCDTSQSSQV